jgi:hypothetical protein
MTKQEAQELEGMYEVKKIKSQRYMRCRNSIPGGEFWRNRFCNNFVAVGDDIVQVLCNSCVQKISFKPAEKAEYVKSDKPRGWKFWKEYVDSEGNVYHKGIEQPFLKGSLPATEVKEREPKEPVKKLSRKEKEELTSSLGKEISSLKGELMREGRKTFRNSISKELKQKTKKLRELL